MPEALPGSHRALSHLDLKNVTSKEQAGRGLDCGQEGLVHAWSSPGQRVGVTAG